MWQNVRAGSRRSEWMKAKADWKLAQREREESSAGRPRAGVEKKTKRWCVATRTCAPSQCRPYKKNIHRKRRRMWLHCCVYRLVMSFLSAELPKPSTFFGALRLAAAASMAACALASAASSAALCFFFGPAGAAAG